MRRGGVVAALALLLTACEARLTPLSGPPPGAEATLDSAADHLRISRGAAIAIACADQGTTCPDLAVEVDDGAVALARTAFQDELASNGRAGAAPRSALVVAGLSEGETVVRLTWSDGSIDLTVEVVAP